MKITELLSTITDVANSKGLSQPYIVGGLVRDKILNRVGQFNDIDITTGDSGIHFLAKFVAEKLDKYGAVYQVMADGHARIIFGNLKLDFSSNFKVPGIRKILSNAGIEDPSEMMMELYSRDFTCNAALMTLDLKDILDPTGLAIEDINNRVIKTCLPPRLTLGFDRKRVIRVPYLAAKLDFSVDKDIVSWIRKNPGAMNTVEAKYVVKKLVKAIKYNKEKTIQVLNELNLWHDIPAFESMPKEFVNKLVSAEELDNSFYFATLHNTVSHNPPPSEELAVGLDEIQEKSVL